jgi:L-asparaginase II
VATEGRRAAIARLLAAIAAHPDHLSGRDEPTSRIIRATAGRVLLKGGAEGFCLGFVPERGIGIAIKVADGSSRGKMGAMARIIGRLGLLDAEATAALEVAVEPPFADSNGRPAGEVAVVLD